MAGPTRTAAVPPRTVLALVTLITLVACAAGCSKPAASPPKVIRPPPRSGPRL